MERTARGQFVDHWSCRINSFLPCRAYIVPDPVVDIRLFKNWVFTLGSIVGWISLVALLGAEFLMPIFLQTLRG